jgi:FeS assembly SUF system regulator
MRLTSLSDYAVVLLAAIARSPAGARLSATALAQGTGVPLPTAQKLTGRLAAAGLLVTARGSGGGFRLARAVPEISLADIIEAVEGPIAMTNCVDDTRHDCALEGSCAVRPHMGLVNQLVREALASVSLETLAQNTPAHPELAEGLPFSSAGEKERQGFDQLSLSGSEIMRIAQ